MERLKQLGVIPVDKNTLYSLYDDLKHPEDKIEDLERKKLIIRIKRGLYIVSDRVHNQKISSELVANYLYESSYVSLESALAYYGLIPEKLNTTRSVCTKMYKFYDTPIGQFEYIKSADEYYQIGIHQEIIGKSYSFMIATPEKALCDLIVYTNNLRLQSVKAITEYLEENLRFKMSALASFNVGIVEECVNFGRKKTELTQLLKLVSHEN